MLPRLSAARRGLGTAALGLLSACPLDGGGTASDAPTTLTVRMDFSRKAGLLGAPFPSDDLFSGGHVDVSKLANPDGSTVVEQIRAMLQRDARGFALGGGAFFALDGDLGDLALPSVMASVAADAPAFLFDVERGGRHPAVVRFDDDGGPLAAPHLLSLLPYPGVPLRPGARYAAVVRTSLTDGSTRRLAASAEVQALAAGTAPAGLSGAALDGYRAALTALGGIGVAPAEVAGLAVFTTDSPEAQMGAFRDAMLQRPLPAPDQPLVRTALFDDYCVYSSTLTVPDYQQGAAPYTHSGGDWQVDSGGAPVAPMPAVSRLVVTVPRRAMPAGGFPTTVFVRTGAGGDDPLVDRGAQAENGGPPIVAGSGPARELARVGFAGVQLDGPLGGPLRNPGGGNEDYLVFNVFNLWSLRDNLRESALELILLAHVVPTLSIDATDCPGFSSSGASRAAFDGGHLALFGHSMGATIAPLAVAFEPSYRALILSGAGGSFIENVLYKQQPLDLRPAAELLLRYNSEGRTLTESDIALSLFQWAVEPADPMVYARLIVREPGPGAAPRHVLMEQGIVDHYILPDIANALSLPLGLDLAGPELDDTVAELATQTALQGALWLSGRRAVTLPAAGNVMTGGMPAAVTALVAQHPADGIEDGHEVVFQTAAPKHQYRCFLAGFAKGAAPLVPADGAADDPCP